MAQVSCNESSIKWPKRGPNQYYIKSFPFLYHTHTSTTLSGENSGSHTKSTTSNPIIGHHPRRTTPIHQHQPSTPPLTSSSSLLSPYHYRHHPITTIPNIKRPPSTSIIATLIFTRSDTTPRRTPSLPPFTTHCCHPLSHFISLTSAAMPPSYLLYHRGLATPSASQHHHHPLLPIARIRHHTTPYTITTSIYNSLQSPSQPLHLPHLCCHAAAVSPLPSWLSHPVSISTPPPPAVTNSKAATGFIDIGAFGFKQVKVV
nr:hypothetical protein [Tanacetum cinerariifolium]